MKVCIAPIYYIDSKSYINLFDISDIIIYFHIKYNLCISLNKLLALLFFYKTYYNLPKHSKKPPPFEEPIEVKDDYIFIYEINKKYRKYENKSLNLSQLIFDKINNNIEKNKTIHVKTLHQLTLDYANTTEEELKEIVKSIIEEQKQLIY